MKINDRTRARPWIVCCNYRNKNKDKRKISKAIYVWLSVQEEWRSRLRIRLVTLQIEVKKESCFSVVSKPARSQLSSPSLKPHNDRVQRKFSINKQNIWNTRHAICSRSGLHTGKQYCVHGCVNIYMHFCLACDAQHVQFWKLQKWQNRAI